ncbi:MAG TPA: hypothetical protein VMV99_12780, partial [Rhodanobacter sp.]|nr:hypothetical protein [Rhodanobacter sp.]
MTSSGPKAQGKSIMHSVLTGSLLRIVRPRPLASHLAQHVVYDFTVLVLRAEQNDLGILTDFDCVPGRPVEQVTTADYFARSICIGNGEFTLQHVTPMRGLAQIALQALKQG